VFDKRIQELKRFYLLLEDLGERLGGARTLNRCTKHIGWPERGVYFFFEEGERRVHTGTGLRVVRVGTHALKSGSRASLWTRLSQHRGSSAGGGGNHRGSIFRLLIGTALINREGYVCPTWGEGNTPSSEIRRGEVILERAVSAAIGAMSFSWIPVLDDPGPSSHRGFIERNAIALLSNYGREPAVDPLSLTWLGLRCNRERVRMSGLWNSNHVDEKPDPGFLDILEKLVREV